ncbi:FtsX-like permease family protein [Schaalia sp. 19OD2882]|uniref:FtsX-like permease family protein n=1 Tax=Schaalia sp. 19OD2882 TaxID=2794089 RepID=UPI001C1EDD5B|nr:FtsX-like permease family protein [Schaalia sp. 19OD2882]QWW19199.1 FtsX-like permease family protein [Schaalia sp. 19OD2882]
MGPTPLLARRDLRRHPALVLAVAVLAALAGFLGSISTLLLVQYPQHARLLGQQWHTADSLAIFPSSLTADRITARLEAQPGVTQAEVTPVLVDQVRIDAGEHTLEGVAVFHDFRARGRLTHASVTAETRADLDNPVWVPDQLRIGGHYALGDPILVRTSRANTTFHIRGFFQDSYSGVAGINYFFLGLEPSAFTAAWRAGAPARADEGAEAATSGAIVGVHRAWQSEVTGSSPDAAAEANATVGHEVGDPTDPVSSFSLSVEHESVLRGKALSTGILSGILVFAAVLITLVATLTTRSTLRSIIAQDLRSLGTLRAFGYTSAQATRSLTVAFTLVALVSSVIGGLASYAVLPALVQLLAAQSGTTWTPTFTPLSVVPGAAAVGLVVLVTCASGVRRLRRRGTVEALRGGEADHSFTRSLLPLSATPGPLSLLMGVGRALHSPRRCLMVVSTLTLATLAAGLILGLGNALLGDKDTTLAIIGGEIEDLTVHTRPGTDASRFEAQVEALDGVVHAYPKTTLFPRIEGREAAVVAADSDSQFRTRPVRIGRYPRSADEIVIGVAAADRTGIQVGDSLTVATDDTQVSFLVTGVASGGRQLGNFAYVTIDGAKRIDPKILANSLAVHLDHPDDAALTDRVIDRIRDTIGSDYLATSKFRESMFVMLDAYLSVVPATITLLTAFCVVTVLLVVALVTGTILREQRRQMNVMRALGFTGRQVRAQLAWTLLPWVALGAVIGSALVLVTLEDAVGLLLRRVGSLAIDVDVPPLLWAGLPASVLVLAWLLIQVLTLRAGRATTSESMARE